jgi:hypothetical protein
MIYAIGPAYSNYNDNKVELQTPQTPSAPVGTNGVVLGDYVYFVDGGNIYRSSQNSLETWITSGDFRHTADKSIRIKKLP